MTYRPVDARSLAGRLHRIIVMPLCRHVSRRSPDKGSARDLADETIRESFGPIGEMDMERRNTSLTFAYLVLLCIGIFAMILGVACMALAHLLLGASAASFLINVCAAVVAAPLSAIGFVWAMRSIVNEYDTRKWRRVGRPDYWTPKGTSQPKDRDFLYALPICVFIAAMLLG